MDTIQTLSLMQQYKQEGKDIDALIADYQTLASSGKTPLGLNQWVKTDKPRMEDFNEDNRIIDEKLRELSAEKAEIANLTQISNADIVASKFTATANCYRTISPLGEIFHNIEVTSTADITSGDIIATMGANRGSKSTYFPLFMLNESGGSMGIMLGVYAASNGRIQVYSASGALPVGGRTLRGQFKYQL